PAARPVQYCTSGFTLPSQVTHPFVVYTVTTWLPLRMLFWMSGFMNKRSSSWCATTYMSTHGVNPGAQGTRASGVGACAEADNITRSNTTTIAPVAPDNGLISALFIVVIFPA